MLADQPRIIVAGPRGWTDKYRVFQVMDEHCRDATVISGCAPGVDSFAIEWAELNGRPVIRFPALWSEYGHDAGFIRNHQMIREGRPTGVLAFQYVNRTTPGTQNMMKFARAANVPLLVFTD